MGRIWIVAEDEALARTIAAMLQDLGESDAGPPERSHWRDVGPADLIVIAAGERAAGEVAGLEGVLDFLASMPRERRAPAPVLWIEPPGGQPPAELVRQLVDDRPLRYLAWPPDAESLSRIAAELLSGTHVIPSLRERMRRAWVTRRMERLYAGVDLPILRAAIDPRNAARPVLLVGETGTGKSLIAHYIHQLAEPPRDRLVALPADALTADSLEARLSSACAEHRVTLHLSRLERAPAGLLAQIGELLGGAGGLALEPIRWILSMTHLRATPEAWRGLPLLRVDLPPLRSRPDFEPLARAMTQEIAHQQGKDVTLLPEAAAKLRELAWLGNLRELEELLSRAVAMTPGPTVGEEELRAVLPGTVERVSDRPPPVTAAGPPPAGAFESAAPEVRPVGEPPPLAAAAAPRTEAGEPEADSAPRAADTNSVLPELIAPLVQEIRQPLLAIRTYAGLLERKPDDEKLRQELSALVVGDLPRLEGLLGRLERFARLGPPRLRAIDLSSLVASVLEEHQTDARARSLVVLRELEEGGPPAHADEAQLRFALDGLMSQALRMVPEGGDLYIGTHCLSDPQGTGARHRLLIRFHSPEDVLIAPDDSQGPRMPAEVIMARTLIRRMHGRFAVDSSGAQDNLILIELASAAT